MHWVPMNFATFRSFPLPFRRAADIKLPGHRVARPKRLAWAWEVWQMTLAIHHALRASERATLATLATLATQFILLVDFNLPLA